MLSDSAVPRLMKRDTGEAGVGADARSAAARGDNDVTAMLDRLQTLTTERLVGALATLRRIERATEDLLDVAIGN